MLQCVAVRCSVLQCVAVYCNVLTVCRSLLQCVAVCCSVWQGSTVRHVCEDHIVCVSVFVCLCVRAYICVCAHMQKPIRAGTRMIRNVVTVVLVAVCCRASYCVTVCCSAWQCIAARCSAYTCVCAHKQKPIRAGTPMIWNVVSVVLVAVCCSVLQCVTVCCSALQRTAVRCSAYMCVCAHVQKPVRAGTRMIRNVVTVVLVAVCCSVLQCVEV